MIAFHSFVEQGTEERYSYSSGHAASLLIPVTLAPTPVVDIKGAEEERVRKEGIGIDGECKGEEGWSS